jgi:membrane protein implicated in regulation of membrane protease activity
MIDYFKDNLWLVWLIISVVCVIIEVTSFDFFVTCFAIGALGAMVAAIVGLPLWVQIIVWAIVSVLSIKFIRPVLTNNIHASGDNRASNADALIGREGKVIETIVNDGFGYVKIDGDEWRSVADDGQEIAKGTRVRVVSRDSIILTVTKIL